MTEVVIVDSGGANLASIQFALERLNARAYVTRNPRIVSTAARVVLPGVGSAPDAMRRLRDAGLIDQLLLLSQPVLGICLGMQLLFNHSEEGATKCLGVMSETVCRLNVLGSTPVPHAGWNQLKMHRQDPLLDGIRNESYAYFVHSYAAHICSETLATTSYDVPFSSVVRTRNFWGVQFHPERSGSAGARILANFLRL